MTLLGEALDTLALLVRGDASGAADRLRAGQPEASTFFELCRGHGLGPVVFDAFGPQRLAGLLVYNMPEPETRRFKVEIQITAPTGDVVMVTAPYKRVQLEPEKGK